MKKAIFTLAAVAVALVANAQNNPKKSKESKKSEKSEKSSQPSQQRKESSADTVSLQRHGSDSSHYSTPNTSTPEKAPKE